MKKLIPLLLTLLLLLCACGSDAPAEDSDSAPAPESTSASAETEDTRPSYEVYWFMHDRDVKTVVKEGDTPVPPTDITQSITTSSQILTFSGWDKEPEPVTAEYVKNNRLVFRAQYDHEKRTFTVRYVADGKEIYSASANYGDKVPCPVDPPHKDGYSCAIWQDEDVTILSDTTREAVYTVYDADQLMWAYKTSLLSFSDTPGANDNSGGVLNESAAILYMLMEVRKSPNGVWTPKFIDRTVESLKYMVGEKGVAPFFSLEPYWCYNTLTAAIAVAKETPAVWDKLTAAEKEKYDFIMEAFAYILAFGTADGNDFRTGPGFRGNYAKSWNPNYRLAVITPMLFIGKYFGGAEKVDAILAGFSYDKTIAKFKEYGFERAYAEWTAEPPTKPDGTKAPDQKTVMENGGTIWQKRVKDGITTIGEAGKGKGVRVAYKYSKCTVDEVAAIYNKLLEFNFSGGAVVSQYGAYDNGSPKAYIVDGTKSPYEGQMGMMKEFAGSDGGGIRSAFGYCSHDFIMICAALAAMEELDMYDLKKDADEKLYNMTWVGMMDTIYKGEHGYMSYSLGTAKEARESTSNGYMLWKNWWLSHYGEK